MYNKITAYTVHPIEYADDFLFIVAMLINLG